MSDIEFVEPTETELDIGSPGETIEMEFPDEDREEGIVDIDYSHEDDEDPFSDRNRWRRGGIIDPDANEW